MQRITYFTAGRVATEQELAEISAIKEDIAPKFELHVFSSKDNPNYGAGPMPTDFVAGTVPEMEAYENVPTFEVSGE